MLVKKIKSIAAGHGIKTHKKKKDELIRAIQTAEGNSGCFQSDIAAECGENGCLWRMDCIPKA